MGKKPMKVGHLPRVPRGKMTEPGFGEGWDRAHNFDQVRGQPKRIYRTKGGT